MCSVSIIWYLVQTSEHTTTCEMLPQGAAMWKLGPRQLSNWFMKNQPHIFEQVKFKSITNLDSRYYIPFFNS